MTASRLEHRGAVLLVDEIYHGDRGSERQTALLIDVGIISSQFYDRILITNKTIEWEVLQGKETLFGGNRY